MLQVISSLSRIVVCSATLMALLVLSPVLVYGQTTYSLVEAELYVPYIAGGGEWEVSPTTVGTVSLPNASFSISAHAWCLEFAEESLAEVEAQATFTWEFTGTPNTTVNVRITGREVLTSDCIGFFPGDVALASNALSGSPNIFGSGITCGLTSAAQYNRGQSIHTVDVTEDQDFQVSLGPTGKGTLTVTHGSEVHAEAATGVPEGLGIISQSAEAESIVYVTYSVTIL